MLPYTVVPDFLCIATSLRKFQLSYGNTFCIVGVEFSNGRSEAFEFCVAARAVIKILVHFAISIKPVDRERSDSRVPAHLDVHFRILRKVVLKN